MAVLMFVGSSLNANATITLEEDGKASDCARYWRNAVLTLAENNGVDANTAMLTPTMSYIEAYMIGYTACVNGD